MSTEKFETSSQENILFPKTTFKQLALLLLIGIVVLLIPAGAWDIRGPDEGRYTQVAIEILENDRWLTLTVLDQPYDQKPPLAFWIYAFSLWLNGGNVSAWFLRLFPVLAAFGTVVLTYFLGKRFQNAQAGFLSALILLATPLFLDDAPAVELNMFYTFFLTATLFVWLYRDDLTQKLSWNQFALFWFFLVCAFFIKGPVGILVVLSPPIFLAILYKSPKILRTVRPVTGFIILFACMGLWFYAQKAAYGKEFVENQIAGETVNRFLQGSHDEPFYYYFLRFFTTIFFPWIFFLIPAGVHIWKNRPRELKKYAAYIGWFLIPFILFNLSNGKRDSYLLPLLPALAIVTGTFFESRLKDIRVSKTYQNILCAFLALCSIGMFTVFVLTIVNPSFLSTEFIDQTKLNPPFWFAMTVIFGYLALLTKSRLQTLLHVLLLFAGIIFLVRMIDLYVVRPALNPRKSSRPFTEIINKTLLMRNENTIATDPSFSQSEYHVYGNYHVIQSVNLDAPEKLPGLLVLKPKQSETSATQLLQLGYKEFIRTRANKDKVVIFVKDSSTTSTTEKRN